MASRGDRTGVALRGTATMLAARGVGFAATLACVAIATRRLTAPEFGLWSVLGTFAVFGVGLDLGLAEGLRNRLAVSAAGDGAGSARLFFSVIGFLGALAAVLAVVAIGSTNIAPWSRWLGASSFGLASLVPVTAVGVIVLFLAAMPFTAGATGFLAYQEADRRSLWDVVQSVFLVLVVIALAGRIGIKGFIWSYYGSYLVAAVLACTSFLRRRGWELHFPPVATVIVDVRSILRSSMQFWALGVAALVVMSSDPLIAASVLGLAEAGEFSVVQRFFTTVVTVHLTVLTPLWSAYTHAVVAGDWAWVRRVLRQSLFVTVALVGVGGSAAVLAARPLLRLWTGRDIDEPELLIALLVWAVLYSLANCYSVLLNGLGHIRRQATVACIAAALNWPLSSWLGQRMGPQGIIWGTTILLVPTLINNVIQAKRGVLERREVRLTE